MPRQPVPDDLLHLEQFLPYRLSVLANIASASIASFYAARHDLTPPEWRVIAVLAREPGLSAAQVAQRTAMGKVSVSRAVARLLRRRRIARRNVPTDRRRSRLQLTAAGMAIYRQVSPQALGYEQELLAALSPVEARRLDAALGRLLDRARVLAAASIIPATTD